MLTENGYLHYLAGQNLFEFQQDSYKLYYKPYSLWSLACQNVYNTTYVASRYTKIETASTNVQFVQISSFISTSWFFIILFLSSKLTRGRAIYSALVDFILIAFVLASYTYHLYTLIRVDFTFLQYAVANNCSNAVLQYSLSNYYQVHKNDMILSCVGIGFAIGLLAMSLAHFISTLRVRNLWFHLFVRHRPR